MPSTWVTPSAPPVGAPAPEPAGSGASAPVSSASAVLALPPTQAAGNAQTGSRGVAVLALGDASGVAWQLARAVYADAGLRPATLDEAHARVLAGEPPDASAGAELHELADTRAAIKGDDAPSRRLLASIARTLRVTAIVVVMQPPTVARVFVAETERYDSPTFTPDEGTPNAWAGATQSIRRLYAAPPVPLAVPPAATQAPKEGGRSTPFYQSPWFWGAIGAAAFGAAAVYFATRDNSPSTIHLQVQVPK